MLAPTLPTLPDHSADSQISHREVKIWKMPAIAALVLLSLASVSYVRSLTTPGYAAWNAPAVTGDTLSAVLQEHFCTLKPCSSPHRRPPCTQRSPK